MTKLTNVAKEIAEAAKILAFIAAVAIAFSPLVGALALLHRANGGH